jgi:hypothetical protein
MVSLTEMRRQWCWNACIMGVVNVNRGLGVNICWTVDFISFRTFYPIYNMVANFLPGAHNRPGPQKIKSYYSPNTYEEARVHSVQRFAWTENSPLFSHRQHAFKHTPLIFSFLYIYNIGWCFLAEYIFPMYNTCRWLVNISNPITHLYK